MNYPNLVTFLPDGFIKHSLGETLMAGHTVLTGDTIFDQFS